VTRATHHISVQRLRELAAAGWCPYRIDRAMGLSDGTARYWATKLDIPLAGQRRSHKAPTDDLRARA
jgi:hypothetical protein